MKSNPDVLTLLGFAQKSNKLISGEKAVEALLKKEKIKLLLIASDLSEKRQSSYIHWCKDINLKYVIFGNKIDFGIALGMSPRSVIGITDEQMAKVIYKKFTV